MTGAYNTIVADPPWRYDYPGGPGNASPWRTDGRTSHYPTMTLDAICALDVASLAAPGCHLYLWVTTPIIARAFQVLEAWGFQREPVTVITWDKSSPGLGAGWRSSAEFLIGARDRRRRPYLDRHAGTIIAAPRGRHSAKPAVFQDTIERMSPGPYIELFARAPRPGWDVWGNEVTSTVEIA